MLLLISHSFLAASCFTATAFIARDIVGKHSALSLNLGFGLNVTAGVFFVGAAAALLATQVKKLGKKGKARGGNKKKKSKDAVEEE